MNYFIMKQKFFTLFIGAIFIVLLLKFAWPFVFHQKDASQFSVLKSSCRTLSENLQKDGLRHYKNEQFNFEFDYPNDVIVCEQGFSSTENSYSIMLWKQADFLENTPQTRPLAILDIDSEDILSQLPASQTDEPVVIDIDGVSASSVQAKSTLCVKTTCPKVTLVHLEYHQHTYSIQIFDAEFSFLQSIRWIR